MGEAAEKRPDTPFCTHTVCLIGYRLFTQKLVSAETPRYNPPYQQPGPHYLRMLTWVDSGPRHDLIALKKARSGLERETDQIVKHHVEEHLYMPSAPGRLTKHTTGEFGALRVTYELLAGSERYEQGVIVARAAFDLAEDRSGFTASIPYLATQEEVDQFLHKHLDA